MDIGSNTWMKNIDNITNQIKESLSLEGTVLTQRASELQAEALKVCYYAHTVLHEVRIVEY